MASGSSFSVTHTGLARVLITYAGISPAFDPHTLERSKWPVAAPFNAIWDTGATHTVITQAVVDRCHLKPTGMTKVSGVNGEHMSETYFVNIELPNKTGFCAVKVTKGSFTGGEVLIGMDVISLGDFAITHRGGKTLFSFQHPSCASIDFKAMQATVGPNDRCSCSSGKKFKKCCGSFMR